MHTAAFLAFLGTAGVLPTPPPTTLQLVDPEPDAAEEEHSAEQHSSEVAEQLALRRDLRVPHIIAGNATFGSMTGAFIFGWLHYADRFGYTGDLADSGCQRGDPILGTEMCANQPPWPHLIGSAIAVTAFSAALIMGFFMPDPLNIADQEGERADWLEVHRALRWGLLGLLVAQVALGVVSASVDLGDPNDDRALATSHLVLGAVTYATLIPMAITGWLLAWG